ncbi:MAG: LysE family translocator [Proteobacteria bacterium]|nr:LysE family translocator [Pseudomonadota bacterium]
MTFIPDLTTLLGYTAASLVLFLTPGPDMSLFLSRTIASGRLAGIVTNIGTNLGCVVHTLLAAFGVSALIAASHAGFLALKIVGAGYLLWLAFNALRKGSSLTLAAGAQKQASLLNCFLLGLTVNLTNPKVVLFFITFLPQFVSASDPHVTGKLLFLGLWFVALSIPPTLLMIWGAHKLVGWLKLRPRIMRAIDATFAGVFAFFALRIALTQGR